MERIIPEIIERLSHAEREERAINILHAWYKKYGTLANIKTDSIFMYKGESINIKYIVSKIKTLKDKGKLSQETINQLEDMGIEWAYDRFSAIRAYYKEFGTLEGINSKTIYEHNGKQVNLHNTIYMLRQNYKNGTLSQEVIDEFTSMGMIWSIKMQYEDKVTMFKQYCLDGGALKDISKTTIYHYNGRDIKMGEIVSDLREKYANKELPEDIVAQLNDIGMVWSVRPRINADKMDLFRAYFSEYGTLADIKSSTKYTYQGREICLGLIVFNWRRGERKEKLTQEEIDELTNMGMIWEVRDTSIELKLNILRAYVDAGNCVADIEKDTVFEYNGEKVKMYSLIVRLRDLNRENKLSNDEKKIIAELGAMPSKKSLEERYEVLAAYYKQYGTLENVAADEEFEHNGTVYNIGRQITALRARHTSNQLSKSSIEFLESMGMAWRKRDIRRSFADKIEVLEAYVEQTNKRLSQVLPDEVFKFEGNNVKINSWLKGFRMAYNSGELSPKQVLTLERLGIQWDGKKNQHDIHFDKQVEILEQYASEHNGTIRGAKSREIYYYEGGKVYLKDLIYRIQSIYSDTLTENQIERLTAIGMVWGDYRNYKIEVLQHYCNQFGSIEDIKMTEKYEYKGHIEPVGRWIHSFRTQYKLDQLDENITSSLESLGMIWDARHKKGRPSTHSKVK